MKRAKQGKYQRAGFTLIEILVALALLVSTTALAAPNVMEALDGSEDKADAAQMDYLLASFQMHQAPFFDSHTNPYDMLNPAYQAEDGTIHAEQALNLYLKDVLDPEKEVYIEGVQCVTTQKSEKDGASVFKAESSGDKLWISCRMDGNRSNAEIRIPAADHLDYEYSTGGSIRWGDTLLYIGDYENLETRFVTGTCQDYRMEAGFYYDNYVHQDNDHKSHMGIAFNYLDDENFCMIDLELKNGTKKIAVYQIQNGIWKTLMSDSNVPKIFDVQGNEDFSNEVKFDSKVEVVNSESGKTSITFWMKPEGGSYQEIFAESFSISDEKKSSRYGFYIGEPSGNGNSTEFTLLKEEDLPNSVDQEDVSTYVYENVQIQLLKYPTFICEGEEDGGGTGNPEPSSVSVTSVDFTGNGVTAKLSRALRADEEIQYLFYNKSNDKEGKWGTSSRFGGSDNKAMVSIRILREGSVVFGPRIFTKQVEFEVVEFVYSLMESKITMSGSNPIEYEWVSEINVYSTPESGMESDQEAIDYEFDLAQSGWLWAREYADSGQVGDWSSTPWIGTDEFNDSKLVKDGSRISFSGSLPSVLSVEYRLNNGSWIQSRPTPTSDRDIIQARVMYQGQQVSQMIRYASDTTGSDVSGPIITIDVDTKFKKTGNVWVYDGCDISIRTNENVTLTGDLVTSIGVGQEILYSYDKKVTELSFTATNDLNKDTPVNISLITDRENVVFGN